MSDTRRYDIDALRVLAFFILILYHVAMFYVADWGWHIKSAYQSEWLKFPMILINQWRMPLLFLISGVASTFFLRKLNTAAFLKRRCFRLLLPFVIGALLIVPPQAFLQATSNGTLASTFGTMNYLEFLQHYFTFQGWPEGAFDGSDYGFTWNHLWFVPYLVVYTLALVPLRALLKVSKLEVAFSKLGAFGLILLPVLIHITWKIVLNDEQGINHSLIDDGYGHAVYFTFFVLGYLISDKVSIWAVILKLRWLSLVLAIGTYCSLISLWWIFNQYEWQDHLAGVIATFNQWLWLLAVLGWSATLLNKPFTWVRYSNDRVYPWYIFHQTLTILAGYYLAPLELGGFTESSIVLLITVGGCGLLTHFVIERSRILGLIFGLKSRASAAM